MSALPLETSEYRDARAALLEAEIALKEQRERVAQGTSQVLDLDLA